MSAWHACIAQHSMPATCPVPGRCHAMNLLLLLRLQLHVVQLLAVYRLWRVSACRCV